MSLKYRVQDRVYLYTTGDTGTIISVFPDSALPYDVQIDGKYLVKCFSENQLELDYDVEYNLLDWLDDYA